MRLSTGPSMREPYSGFARQGSCCPTYRELADPVKIPDRIRTELASVDPHVAHPLNLFRVHWCSGSDRKTQVDGASERASAQDANREFPGPFRLDRNRSTVDN